MQLSEAERQVFSQGPDLHLIQGRNSFPAAIEDTPLPIKLLDRMSLVLVYTGLKPTALVNMSYGFNSSDALEIGWQKIGATKRLLDSGDFSYQLRLRRYKKAGLSEVEFYVGRDDVSVDLLISGFAENDDFKTGLALGYPGTAVKAYSQKPVSERDFRSLRFEETEEVFGDLVPFMLFRPSRDHWQEEMELVRTWAETVKAVAPKLYRDIVG